MLDFDPTHRAEWDAALVAYLTEALPGATFSWIEFKRRLVATFPGGRKASIWEPNFYFSRKSLHG